MDRALCKQAVKIRPLDTTIMSAVFQILSAHRDDLKVSDLARASGLSLRHFRRRFVAAVELSAIELMRVQRVRATVRRAVEGAEAEAPLGWAALAAHYGYSDQAHLVREFRNTMGLTPTEFERHFGRIEHGSLVR